MSTLKVTYNFLLKSARDLGASVKHGNKWCQMCALTHCLAVEIRMSKSLAVWYRCVCVLHAVCYIMQARPFGLISCTFRQATNYLVSYVIGARAMIVEDSAGIK